MKRYEAPEMEVLRFAADDVITGSGAITLPDDPEPTNEPYSYPIGRQ